MVGGWGGGPNLASSSPTIMMQALIYANIYIVLKNIHYILGTLYKPNTYSVISGTTKQIAIEIGT